MKPCKDIGELAPKYTVLDRSDWSDLNTQFSKINVVSKPRRYGDKIRPKRKHYSIIDKVYRMTSLHDAWNTVKANKGSAGVDGETIQWFTPRMCNIGVHISKKTGNPVFSSFI